MNVEAELPAGAATEGHTGHARDLEPYLWPSVSICILENPLWLQGRQ